MSGRNNIKKKYEVANYISDNGDSMYAAPVEESRGGQIFYSLDAIRDIINEELDKRLGPWVNKNNYEDE
jgi:hypothetical protein